MKNAAIIAEYNPFHNGHAHQIRILREQYAVTHVISIMSGSFTQRGGPAIFDKMIRARQAVLGGADLVVELPYVYCGQTAEVFAIGGVGLADRIKADVLCFGCETDDIDKFRTAVKVLNHESEEFQNILKEKMDKGYSFAVSRLIAMEEISGEDLQFLSEPNNILALEYMRQIDRLESNLTVIPILRKGAHHHADKLSDKITSASYIRKKIKEGKSEEIFCALPEVSYQSKEEFNCYPIHDIENYKDIIKAQIILKSKEELSTICDMETGLENRMKESAGLLSVGVEPFIDKVATKRYAKSRIRRILINMLMQYTKEDMLIYKNSIPNFVRVLSANQRGRELIKHIKKSCDIQAVSNLSKDIHSLSELDKKIADFESKAYDLYHLFEKDHYHDLKLKPVIIESAELS